MLNLAPCNFIDCERTTRRGAMQIGGLAGLGISLPSLLAARSAQAREAAAPRHAGSSRDMNCILVWTQGGTSHHAKLRFNTVDFPLQFLDLCF